MKTPEEHNRYLGYAHLAYGAFQLLMALLMIVISFIIFAAVLAEDGGEFPAAIVAAVLLFSFFIQLVFTVPSMVAGFGLLKRRSWAKTATMIAGVLSSISFPFGLAVTIYTFWFIFSPEGKKFYEGQSSEARVRPVSFLDAPDDPNGVGSWTARRDREYVPPKQMPDWR